MSARKKVEYTPANLEAFAEKLLLTNCPETAYRLVFNTRGREKNLAAGAVLAGDERVRAMVEAVKTRQTAAVLAAAVAGARAGEMRERGQQMELGAPAAGELGESFDAWAELPKMLRKVAYLSEHGESDTVKLKAAENYDKLLARVEKHERGEDVPAELLAFIEEMERGRSTLA